MVKRFNKGYGISNPLQDVFPSPIVATRDPTTSDTNYQLGQVWVNSSDDQSWTLTSVSSGSANWALASPGSSDVNTIGGDSGTANPAGGNINIVGGTNITTTGASPTGDDVSVDLDAAITLATSVSSPLYTVAAGTDLSITGVSGQDVIVTLGGSAGSENFIVEAADGTDLWTIDSSGTITFTNFSNTGTFTTSGGAASINASSNFNTVINSGTSTGTVTIGNASAGAITVDSGSGISIDSAGASNFTVASADLTLQSTGGSIGITSTEAVSDAIVIHASDGAGGVQVQAGTGGVLIGNQADCTTIDIGDTAPTASRTITVGGGTVVTASVTDTIDIAPDGATTNADSVKTVNVNSGGVTTGQVLTNIATGAITSGTHTVSIQSGNAAAGTVATNISTGTGTKTVSIGNSDANTTVNIDAVTLINDSVNANTSINTGTSTGTVSVGNSSAGAVTVDSGAGIDITSAEAASSDGVNIVASAADGGVTLDAGSGGILVGISADCTPISVGDVVPTSARTITVGGGTVATAIADTIDIGPDGADTDAGASKVVNINTGGVTLATLTTNIGSGAVTSGTHTVNIQSGNAAGGTVATNISTGTGTKTVNFGNSDANTTVNIDAVTLINDSVNANTSINTGTSTGTVSVGNAAAGAITVDTAAGISLDAATASNFTVTGAADLTLTSTAGSIPITAGEADAAAIALQAASGGLDIDTGLAIIGDAAGNIELNSSAGQILIGNDDVDQNASFATDGERTVTVGSTNGAAALVLQSGTGKTTMTGTVQQIDANFVGPVGVYVPAFTQGTCAVNASNQGGAATGTDTEVNALAMQGGYVMEEYLIGTQTIIQPIMSANGLVINGDQTNGEGLEFNFPYLQYTIGTSAAFFFELGLYINDMDGAAPYVFGFRKTEANNATFANYTDYATVGMNAATDTTHVTTLTELNGGGQTATASTDLWGGDGSTNTLAVLVDASGNVTYTLNGSSLNGAVAFQFDNTDVVIPIIRIGHSASATDVAITSMRIGFQA
jgi:hypothetical protein